MEGEFYRIWESVEVGTANSHEELTECYVLNKASALKSKANDVQDSFLKQLLVLCQ